MAGIIRHKSLSIDSYFLRIELRNCFPGDAVDDKTFIRTSRLFVVTTPRTIPLENVAHVNSPGRQLNRRDTIDEFSTPGLIAYLMNE
jgi:hypothetical protein